MLVGRTRELERLERALDACVAGRGSMLLLRGEAGIGKTHLADELTERAVRSRGFAVVWGRAWETDGAPPYWPWIECLRTLIERFEGAFDVPPALRDWVETGASSPLPDAPSGTRERVRSDPDRERFELFTGVATLLRAAAKQTPLLVVLDDLHAADLASLELLALVARGLRMSRIVALGTCRDVEARRAPVLEVLSRIVREAEVFPLQPLPPEDVAEIVRHELGTFDATLAARVFDVTEGNPLFVRETLHALSLSRSARGRAGESTDEDLALLLGTAPTGSGVTALVHGRLAGASSETLALLELGAALGREIDPVLLASAAGTPVTEVLSALGDAATRGILFTRGGAPERWIFSHVLVRDALYRAIAPERRRSLHEAIQRALGSRIQHGLSSEEQLATLTHHAMLALPTGEPRDVSFALDCARRAAERARGQLAHSEAMAILERALEVHALYGDGSESGHHTELLLALGWVATEVGALDRGRQLFRQVAELARRTEDGRLLARAALGQGGAFVHAEVRTELVAILREALAALGDGADADPEARRLVARLLARLAGALTPSADPEEPLGLARRALSMTRRETDLRTRVDVDLAAGSALIDFAPPVERIAVAERLLRDTRESGDRVLELRALTRLSCDYIANADLVSAAMAIDARDALGRALGSARYRWATPLLRSMRAMIDGRFDECEALATEAEDITTESPEDPNATRSITLHRFCLSIIAGRNDQLETRMTDALRVVEPLGNLALQFWIVATGAAALGDRPTALDATRKIVFDDSIAGKAFSVRAMVANAAATLDTREEAALLYEWLGTHIGVLSSWGPFAFICGPPVAQARAAVAFTAGHQEAGVAHSEAALAVCAETGARGFQPWVHLTWGEGLARKRDREATRHLGRALDVANELGMPIVAVRAERALTSVRGVASRPPPAPATFDFTLQRVAEKWELTRDGRTFRLKDMRGVAMLARLIENPGREIHSLDLASDVGGVGAAVDVGDAGEVLDARARDAYKTRVAELRSELEEAEGFADAGRAERARTELEALTEQLAGAIGLGGRARRVGSAAERARITVQRRVREAIKKIAEEDAELGRHLDWTVRTGIFAAYEPEGRHTSH